MFMEIVRKETGTLNPSDEQIEIYYRKQIDKLQEQTSEIVEQYKKIMNENKKLVNENKMLVERQNKGKNKRGLLLSKVHKDYIEHLIGYGLKRPQIVNLFNEKYKKQITINQLRGYMNKNRQNDNK